MTAVTLDAISLAGWSIDDHPTARRTMDRMAGMVQRALNDPRIIQYANEIAAAARPRDYPAQIQAIRGFMETYFRFVDNPVGRQRIQDPWSMIQFIERDGYVLGACDDAAVLVAAFGMADALLARFRAVAFAHEGVSDVEEIPFSHVITDLWDGAEWEELDVTRPADMTRPPRIVRTLVLEL